MHDVVPCDGGGTAAVAMRCGFSEVLRAGTPSTEKAAEKLATSRLVFTNPPHPKHPPHGEEAPTGTRAVYISEREWDAQDAYLAFEQQTERPFQVLKGKTYLQGYKIFSLLQGSGISPPPWKTTHTQRLNNMEWGEKNRNKGTVRHYFPPYYSQWE